MHEEIQKQILRQHLQRKRESTKLASFKGETVKTKETSKPSEASVASKKPHPVGAFKHQPSYDEIPLNREISVEHLPNRKSAVDNDMWAKVKYPHNAGASPISKKNSSMGRHLSMSSGDLTSNSGSDYYSNLADLDLGADGEGVEDVRGEGEVVQRSRSFSEHERVVIKATNPNR